MHARVDAAILSYSDPPEELTMPRHLISSSADAQRGTLFWTVVSSLLVGQLVQLRDTTGPVQRAASEPMSNSVRASQASR